jgi:hypothetical protein
MKQLFTILFLTLATIAKSQDTVKIPTPIAKQIARELVGCDSTKAVLELTKEQLTLTESKVVLKDSIISNHIQKGIMYEERIKNEQLKFDTQGKFVDILRNQNKKLKVKLLFTKITYSAVIGGLTYLYFTK